MEFRVLRYFLTIAREGSTTNAASSLHITQPTLSRQICDLEKEMEQMNRTLETKYDNLNLTVSGVIQILIKR